MVVAALNELGTRKLVVDLNMPLPAAAVLVKACPGTRFVVEHLGGAPTTDTTPGAFATWEKEINELAAFDNIDCLQLGGVMSGWGSKGAVDIPQVTKFIKAAIKQFGFKRTCFEGNWFFNNWGFVAGFLLMSAFSRDAWSTEEHVYCYRQHASVHLPIHLRWWLTPHVGCWSLLNFIPV
jgi:predicted TIM-barrel fold metal-dependent hydrolase